MANITADFYMGADQTFKNEGNNYPSWFNAIDDKSTWYGNDNFNYHYNIMTNTRPENEFSFTLYVQYGQNVSGWASAKFFIFEIDGTYTTLSDNSVDANTTIKIQTYASRPTDYASAGYPVTWDLSVFNISIIHIDVNTIDSFSYVDAGSANKTINIPYGGETSETTVHISATYPTGVFPDTELNMGLTLTNEAPSTYYPFAVRVNNHLVSYNDSPQKTTAIRKSGTLTKLPPMNIDDQNKSNVGNTQYRNNGTMKQTPISNSN